MTGREVAKVPPPQISGDGGERERGILIVYLFLFGSLSTHAFLSQVAIASLPLYSSVMQPPMFKDREETTRVSQTLPAALPTNLVYGPVVLYSSLFAHLLLLSRIGLSK